MQFLKSIFNKNRYFIYLVSVFVLSTSQIKSIDINEVYEKIKTPYKYGVVYSQKDKDVDSPSIFLWKDTWYMVYIEYDGSGYSTHLAKSKDLLEWKKVRTLLEPTYSYEWDANQVAGYLNLLPLDWNDNRPLKYENKYWMTYIGSNLSGYEPDLMSIGIAESKNPLKNWKRHPDPVLSVHDDDTRWFETKNLYRSTIIKNPEPWLKYDYLIFYNGESDLYGNHSERIGLAGTNDLINWERIGDDPLVYLDGNITGDPQIKKIDDAYVMFYFNFDFKNPAYDTFAVSEDLVIWEVWDGPPLIQASEDYDYKHAHKPCVIYHKGIVYHFYTAVGSQGRVIALATSKDLNNK